MTSKLLNWFNKPEKQNTPALLSDVETAAVILMVEIISADDHMDSSEEALLRQIIQQQLKVSPEEIEQVVHSAKQSSNASLDFYQHTKKIRDNYSIAQKKQLLEHLWSLVYADGKLDKYEDYAIRKIADLIYIPQSQFIQARNKVKSRLAT